MNTDSYFAQRIKQCLSSIQENAKEEGPNVSRKRQAAVLVPFILQPEPTLLLTVRAAHLKSHPGQISFPGGMVEAEDRSIVDTALRETWEEVGIAPEVFHPLGQLSATLSKDAIEVFPVVAAMDELIECKPNADETAEVFTVPWSFFTRHKPRFQPIERHGVRFEIPHFDFEGRDIWGLTAMVILELLNRLEGCDYPLPSFKR